MSGDRYVCRAVLLTTVEVSSAFLELRRWPSSYAGVAAVLVGYLPNGLQRFEDAGYTGGYAQSG